MLLNLIATSAALLASVSAVPPPLDRNDLHKRALGVAWTGSTQLSRGASTGVSAQQISVVDDDHIIIFDKAENNPLKVNGHAAWGSLYTISTGAVRALDMKTNSFCAGGGWLGNGTLVSVGGNPRENNVPSENGYQGLRLFTPCDNAGTEYPTTVRLSSARWYASTVRLEDGSIMVWGGTKIGGYNNRVQTDNPTFEYWPPKGTGQAIYSKFLHDALNTNLFPITYMLPSGKIFVAANRLAMLYDWKSNTEQRIQAPAIRPNYPSSATSVLLPMTIANNWTPDVLLCGGTTLDTDGDPSTLSATSSASTQCSRMTVSDAGVVQGWRTENMPTPRIMGCGILTPDGKVFITGGATNGVGGYGNVANEVGWSNAATPNYSPVLYDPEAPSGSRFSAGFPAAQIERLYHSTATLLPDGRIFTSGSNPNPDVTTNRWGTRYETEIYTPPYAVVDTKRALWDNHPSNINYNAFHTIKITRWSTAQNIRAVIMDLGYSTHGVYMNNRMVELRTTRDIRRRTLTLQGPQGPTYYQPGYAFLYLITDGIVSKGRRVMIGGGGGPSVDAKALNGLRTATSNPDNVTA